MLGGFRGGLGADPPLRVLVLALFGPFELFDRGWGECLFYDSVVSGCVPVFYGIEGIVQENI